MIKKQPNINLGAAILFVIFSLLFFVLLFRFISIQITGEVEGQPLAAKAQQKHEKEKVIEAKRGTIFDRNGKVIAEDAYSYKLIAILDEKMTTNKDKPRHVVNPEKTAKELAKLIDMKETDIYNILTKVNPKTKKKPFQVEFGVAGRDLSYETKRKVEKLKLPGITFTKEAKRFYPNGVFASHLVGYVEKGKSGSDNKTDTVGMLGIEQSLNDALTGKNGKLTYEGDIWGYLLPNGKQDVTPAVNGKNVYLTIDEKIQTFLEDSMNEVEKKYSPEKIIAVVADPKTGEILAMGQRPSFHPKTRKGIKNSWHNEAIENSFEPGSTMKVFTLAAAIEQGVFTPNETYQSGTYPVDSETIIRDHNSGRGWGKITYLEGVQRSSNVAFSKIVKEKLGFDTYRKYLTEFGFEKPTGIELPNEARSKIVYKWPSEKITTAFGQGTAITPIQQIQAVTAIANDGKMMKPYVIKKLADPNAKGKEKITKPEVVNNPISPSTAKQVRDILGTVVSSPKGTGFERFNIEGYEVAGKTGTAQIPNPNGGYLRGHNNYVFSFLGMAPKDDPKLVMYVAVQQPNLEPGTIGADPVSEVFTPVMKSSLQYLNVDPVKQPKIQSTKIPNFIGESVEDTVKQLKGSDLTPIVIGNGKKVTGQLPVENNKLIAGEKVIIRTEGDLVIPDLTGWSSRDVLKVAKLGNLHFNSVGSGYAVKQNMKPGTKIQEGEFLIVELESPKKAFTKENKKEKENVEKNTPSD